MVRNLLFAPAERALVAQEDGSVSLINILGAVTATLPFPPDQIPENSAIPLRWYVLTLWRFEAEDLGSTFYQRVIMEAPRLYLKRSASEEWEHLQDYPL